MEANSARRRAKSKDTTEGVCLTEFVDEKRVAAAQAAMPSEELVTKAADLFSAFADPTRLRLLLALTKRELCVCDLSKVARRSMAATSHQLQLLRRLGLVTYRMEGKLAYYRATDSWAEGALSEAFERVDRSRR